jgi:4-aminobutyrate aminotransferase
LALQYIGNGGKEMRAEDLPVVTVTEKGARTKEVIEKDHAFVTQSYNRYYDIVLEEGKGALVKDVDGNTYLDFTGGGGTAALGHSHPRVAAAIKEQAERMVHGLGMVFYSEPMAEVAERLARLTHGPSNKRVYFGNSGAEANECALKLARFHTKKPGIISFLGGFHGRTMATLSLNAVGSKMKQFFAPFLSENVLAPYPYCYRCQINLTYPDCNIACVDYIQEWILNKIMPPENVGAMIIEPIQGVSGFIVPPDGYFQKLYKLCRDNNILLISDEVFSGMGRTGRFFAIEHWGVEADMMTTAKSIAGGVPLGVCVAKDEVMDWGKGLHATTFAGNNLACAASKAALDAVVEDKLMERAEHLGGGILARLQEMKQRYELVGDVRGKGLMAGLEFVKDREKKTPAPDEAAEIRKRCSQKGILFFAGGASGIRMCPPLVTTEEQIQFALDGLEESIEECGK